MEDRLTPKQHFCAPLLSALLFGGGSAGIADIYVHLRDIVPLSGQDWEPNPVERRLARWHSTLAAVIRHFCSINVMIGRKFGGGRRRRKFFRRRDAVRRTP